MDKSELREFAQMISEGIATGMLAANGQVRPDAFTSRYDEGYKEAELGNPAGSGIYGRNSIFDPCEAGDIWGLQVETLGLMNWAGWYPSTFAEQKVSFIQWWGPSGTESGNASTLATSPCADPDTWVYGDAGYTLCHDSWYSVAGEVLDPKALGLQNRCETSPRYRLNGQMITDDLEWQLNGMLNVLSQAIEYGLIHGSHDNANEMNGLESIVREGYVDKDGQPTPAIDSVYVNWGNDDLDGAVNGFGNFFDYLDTIVDEIEYKASRLGGIREQDMALVTSRFMAKKLLSKFACYSVCGTFDYDGSDPALRPQINAYRRSLNGGPLYDGQRAVGYILLTSGRRVPILVHDPLTIGISSTNYCSDIYLLTRRIGNGRVLYGKYMDLRRVVAARRARGIFTKFVTDAIGRFMQSVKTDNFCDQLILGTSPEWYLSAPWAQVRIEDVCVDVPRAPIVGDPYQTEYHFTKGALYPAQAWDPTCADTEDTVGAIDHDQ